jgi:hypothetical protein
VGYRFSQYKAGAFDVFSGLSFNQEEFSNEADRNSGEILTGEELTYKISDRTSFTERCVVFPNFTNPGEFRINLDSSTLVRFNHWLGWQTSVSNNHLTDPAAGSRTSDLLVTTGIRFTFGEKRTFRSRLGTAVVAN